MVQRMFLIQLSYDASHIVIVIVYGNINKKPLHAKTIRLGSGMCLGPTQRPEEQGQQLREENFIKKNCFLSKSDTEARRARTTAERKGENF